MASGDINLFRVGQEVQVIYTGKRGIIEAVKGTTLVVAVGRRTLYMKANEVRVP